MMVTRAFQGQWPIARMSTSSSLIPSSSNSTARCCGLSLTALPKLSLSSKVLTHEWSIWTKELHLLPINQCITYKLCLMMHFIHTQQYPDYPDYPDYMRDLVSMTATTATRTGLRSASGLSYWKPRIRTKYLQTTTDTNTFKRLLKTYLFTTAY